MTKKVNKRKALTVDAVMDKNVELETKDNAENGAGSNQEEEVIDLFGKCL